MRNFVILLILLLILSGSCISRPQKDPEFVKRLNQVNEILDKMDTLEYWEQGELVDAFVLNIYVEMRGNPEKYPDKFIDVEIASLVENKDIALPLIFKILNRDGTKIPVWVAKVYDERCTTAAHIGNCLKVNQLSVFFYMFWKTKSIESIPYLCEFMRIPKKGPMAGYRICGGKIDAVIFARHAISKITENKVKTLPYNSDISDAEVAAQTQKWYEEHKK